MLSFINSHKTKLTGALLVALGAVQANAGTIQTVIPPRAFAWMTFGIGVMVAVIGFLNSAAQSDKQQ